MLEEEPLNEDGQRRSRALALRAKLRGLNKKVEQGRQLNVKKMSRRKLQQVPRFGDSLVKRPLIRK